MATWTGIVDLETLTTDFSTDGVVITQINSARAGDGVTNTTLRLGDVLTGKNRVLRMNNQIATSVNPNGTPCLDWSDTLIVKTAGNSCFNQAVGGTTPVIRWRRCTFSHIAGGIFLFMWNDNRVQTIFEDVILTFDNYGFGFFGREAIWNNVTIRGNNGGDSFPPNLPLEINGLRIIDHNLFKLEHGSGGMYSVQMLNPNGGAGNFLYVGFGSSTTSDQTDRAMHLVDSPFLATKFSMTNNGAGGAWRTIKSGYKTAAGTGVQNARLYTAYKNGSNWVDYRLTRTRNTSVTAGGAYIAQPTADQDPALPAAQTLRWMYILRPGDRVRLSGFANAINNRDTSIVGLLNVNTNRFYATADRLVVSGANTLVAEATKMATITRLEPISDASGNFTETILEIGFARALNSQGGNGFNSSFTLANYQSGAQVGVPGQTFLRETWEIYIVPPYPYRREQQEFTIPQSAPTLGAKVEWNPLAITDTEITVMNTAIVLAYTTTDTSAKLYDYKEAWKRIEANTNIGGVREGFFTKAGINLDFSAWNIVIDSFATLPFDPNPATNTITIKVALFTGNIKTTGTVTILIGSDVLGTITAPTVNVSGAFSCEVIGTVNQATPTNLVATAKATTLVYNTNTDISVTYATGTEIGTVRNDGTGIVTIAGGSITDYTDAQINYLDSNLSAVGIDSATIYQTQSDRDTGANPGATFTNSLNFKYGSVVNGVTMQNTVYLRVVVGSVTLFAQMALAIGSNTLDLGVQGQLSAIGAKVDLNAKQESLVKMNEGLKKIALYKPYKTDL